MKITVPALMTCCLLAVPGVAQNAGRVKTLTLQDCIDQAIQHNFDLKIERYNPQIERFGLEGSYGYYDPTFNASVRQTFNSSEGVFNPSLNFRESNRNNWNENFAAGLGGYAPMGLRYDLSGNLSRGSGTGYGNDSEYSSDTSITLSQPLLRGFLTDASRANILISKQRVSRAEWTLRLLIMNVVTLVEQGYYDLIAARESVRVQEKALELAERLLGDNKKRVEVGALAPLDEKQAESQVAVNRANLLGAKRALEAQENVLRNLLTDDYRSWHDYAIETTGSLVAVPEKFDLQESWRMGLAQRPDLQQAKIDLEVNNINLRTDRNAVLPDLRALGRFGLTGRDQHSSGALDDIYGQNNPNHYFGFSLSIPLGNITARNNYRQTRSAREQAETRLKKLEQDILVQIDDVVKLAQSNLERIEATKQARLYAEAALDAAQKKLENGKSTSFEVLQLQRNLTDARSAEISALTDYNKSLAQLALRQGSTLERNKLDLKIK